MPAARVRPPMERFVAAVVAGGLALVAGLWAVTLAGARSSAWLAGLALVGGGLAGLGWGIASQVER
jgi:predicted benzoate:H+ symporter BenE